MYYGFFDSLGALAGGIVAAIVLLVFATLDWVTDRIERPHDSYGPPGILFAYQIDPTGT